MREESRVIASRWNQQEEIVAFVLSHVAAHPAQELPGMGRPGSLRGLKHRQHGGTEDEHRRSTTIHPDDARPWSAASSREGRGSRRRRRAGRGSFGDMTEWVEMGASPEASTLREAFRRWASKRLLAPSGLESQLVGVASRDEVLARLAAALVRRTLFEQRAATPPSARPSGARIEAHAIDPFSTDLETLRRRSEHHEPCEECRGLGRVSCATCTGDGRVRCDECGGSGHVTRYYKKSSRVIQCPGCRTKGTVRCGPCGASGQLTCGTCSGVGQQLVWWSFADTRWIEVTFSSESPVLAGHAALRECRNLGTNDLADFTTLASIEYPGQIPAERLTPDDRAQRARLTREIDLRTERIEHEQYVRFAVLRRDVAYETCGMRGEVVLSGRSLLGAETVEAMRPLHVRAVLWTIASLVLAIAAASFKSSLAGPTAYFERVNQRVSVLSWLALIGAVVTTGGLLRAWRPGMRRWPVHRHEAAGFFVSLGSVAVALALQSVSQPSPAEARDALARRDVARARLVVEAISATGGIVAPELRDDVGLAVAAQEQPTARLSSLDAIAARGGARAPLAAREAGDLRVQMLRELLAARRHGDVLASLDRWAAHLAGRTEIAAIRATGHDQRAEDCSGDICRMQAFTAANAAEPTPRRARSRDDARRRVLAALSARPDDADVLRRLEGIRALDALASTVMTLHEDPELATAGRAATDYARAAPARIPLIGSPRAVVDNLLGRSGAQGASTSWSDLVGVAVFTVESSGVCDGIYIVGDRAGARGLSAAEGGVRRLLAQIVGRGDPAMIVRPRDGLAHAVTRWRDGDVTYLARWHDGVAVELRVGRATP